MSPGTDREATGRCPREFSHAVPALALAMKQIVPPFTCGKRRNRGLKDRGQIVGERV